MKETPFLKAAYQGPFSNDDPILIGEPFYELLVGMGSETLFNFLSEGLQINRWGRRRRRGGRWLSDAGQGRDARRRTVKSATPRPAIQKLATARSVGAIYLWFAIGDSSTHLRSTKCVRVQRSEIRKTALSHMVLIPRRSHR
jgi:hypothetical protein